MLTRGTVHHSSARNLGFIFDDHLCSGQISALSKSCYSLFVHFVVSVLTSIKKNQPVPSPHPLSILNLTTATLSIIIFLTPNYTDSIQLIQNSLARTVFNTPKTCHITPFLASLHWLKMKERIEYKLLSVTYKILTTSQVTYIHNLVSPVPSRHPFAFLHNVPRPVSCIMHECVAAP